MPFLGGALFFVLQPKKGIIVDNKPELIIRSPLELFPVFIVEYAVA